MKLPQAVKKWAVIFKENGETERAAIFHAVQRAFEEGAISEKKADALDEQLSESS